MIMLLMDLLALLFRSLKTPFVHPRPKQTNRRGISKTGG